MLAGVLLVTVVVLSAFDLAAVTGLRRYLYNQTDSQLSNVLSLYKPYHLTVAPIPRARKRRFQKVPVNFVKRTGILGPHLFGQPPLFEQYFVAYFMGGKPRLVVGGSRDLEPLFSRKLAVVRHPETVTSATGTLSSGCGRCGSAAAPFSSPPAWLECTRPLTGWSCS